MHSGFSSSGANRHVSTAESQFEWEDCGAWPGDDTFRGHYQEFINIYLTFSNNKITFLSVYMEGADMCVISF